MNPGGSVKDRAALYMINAAEREGAIKKGGKTRFPLLPLAYTVFSFPSCSLKAGSLRRQQATLVSPILLVIWAITFSC